MPDAPVQPDPGPEPVSGPVTPNLNVPPEVRAAKRARWAQLTQQGTAPDDATAQVEREFTPMPAPAGVAPDELQQPSPTQYLAAQQRRAAVTATENAPESPAERSFRERVEASPAGSAAAQAVSTVAGAPLQYLTELGATAAGTLKLPGVQEKLEEAAGAQRRERRWLESFGSQNPPVVQIGQGLMRMGTEMAMLPGASKLFEAGEPLALPLAERAAVASARTGSQLGLFSAAQEALSPDPSLERVNEAATSGFRQGVAFGAGGEVVGTALETGVNAYLRRKAAARAAGDPLEAIAPEEPPSSPAERSQDLPAAVPPVRPPETGGWPRATPKPWRPENWEPRPAWARGTVYKPSSQPATEPLAPEETPTIVQPAAAAPAETAPAAPAEMSDELWRRAPVAGSERPQIVDPLARLMRSTWASVKTDTPIGRAMQTDVEGMWSNTVPSVDRVALHDPSSLREFYDAWQPVREAIRQRYGDTVKLWRVAAPGEGNRLFSRWTDHDFAGEFQKMYGAGSRRQLVSRDVPVDDIVGGVFSGKGYREFYVAEPAGRQLLAPAGAEAGAIHPQVLTTLGSASAGAAVGAAQTPDNRALGAVEGAAAGALLPTIFGAEGESGKLGVQAERQQLGLPADFTTPAPERLGLESRGAPLAGEGYTEAKIPVVSAELDRLQQVAPQPLADDATWGRTMQQVFRSDVVPKAPEHAIAMARTDGSGVERILSDLRAMHGQDATPQGLEQRMASEKAMALTGEIRQILEGTHPTVKADVPTQQRAVTALLLQVAMSPQAPAYLSDSAMLEILEHRVNGRGFWDMLDDVAAGKFNRGEYNAFVDDLYPKGGQTGRLGGQIAHNARRFGNVLEKMNANGTLEKIRQAFSDPNLSGAEARRLLVGYLGRGTGLDTKTLSFSLLLSGKPDVMVLDRIKVRDLWDGTPGLEGKEVYGPLSTVLNGPKGLAIYEAIERGIRENVRSAYRALGIDDGDLSRYHYESWVLKGSQIVEHEPVVGTARLLRGEPEPYKGLQILNGDLQSWQSGVRYEPNSGLPTFVVQTADGQGLKFNRPQFELLNKGWAELGRKAGIQRLEDADVAWFDRYPGLRAARDDLARRYATELAGRDLGPVTPAERAAAALRRRPFFGAQSPQRAVAARQVVGALAGAGAGAAGGYATGDTPGERVRNALLGGAAGVLAGGLALRGGEEPAAAPAPEAVAPEAEGLPESGRPMAAPHLPELSAEQAHLGGMVDPTDFLNIDRMDPRTPEERASLEAAIQRTVARIYPEGRGVRGFDVALANAQKIAADPAALDRIPLNRLTGDERLAHRILLNVQNERLVALGKQAELDPDNVALDAQLRRLQDQVDDRTRKAMLSGTAQGRDLAYNRILASQTLDPTAWHIRALRLLGDDYDKLPDTVRTRINALLEAKDVEGLSRYVASLKQATAAQKLARFFKTNLISSLTTAGRILTGSQADLWMFHAGPTRALEVLADRMLQTYTGVRSRALLGEFRGEAAKAAIRGIGTEGERILHGEPVPGGGRGTGILERGEVTNVPVEEPDGTLGKAYYHGMQALDVYENAVGRTHGLLHRLGWQPAYQQSLWERAILQANEEARAAAAPVTGGKPLVGDAYRARVRELAANPTDEMQAGAMSDADHATFLAKNALATGMNRLKQFLANAQQEGALKGHANLAARGAYLASEALAPFVKISTNIIGRGLETTPLGIGPTSASLIRLMRAVQDAAPAAERQALQAQFLTRASRLGVGSALYYLGLKAAQHGILTGGPTTDPRERQARDAQNAASFQIKLFGRWHSLLALGPLGFPIAAGAVTAQAFRKPELTTGQQALAALTSMPAVAAQESFMRGTQSATEAVADPLGAGARWGQQLGSALIPGANLVTHIAEAADTLQRRPHGLGQDVRGNLPVTRAGTMPRLNIWGDPVPEQRSPVNTLVNPFGSRPDPTDEDPQLREVVRVGALMPTTKRLPDESDETYQQRAQIRGHAARQAVQFEMADPRYQAAETLAQTAMAQDPELAKMDPAEVTRLVQQQLLENAARAAVEAPDVKLQEQMLSQGETQRQTWRAQLKRAASGH